MKYTKFSSLPGITDIDKIEGLFKKARDIYKVDYILCQPKYNGVHMKIKNGRAWTRDNHEWNADILPKQVQELLAISKDPFPFFTFHAEVFSDSIPFETFVGMVSVNRNTRADGVDESDYRVFDVDSVHVEGYEDRMAFVKHRVQTCGFLLTSSIEVADRFFTDSVNLHPEDEGVIYRIPPCFYSDDNSPSPAIIKRKRLHSAEGCCIAIEEGLGKRAGMMGALYVQYGDHVIKVGGGAGLDNARLLEFWKNPPVGKRITFSFEDAAANGMPLRPLFLAVRDYE